MEGSGSDVGGRAARARARRALAAWLLAEGVLLACAPPPPPPGEPPPASRPTLRPSAIQPPQPGTSAIFLLQGLEEPDAAELRRSRECLANAEARAYFDAVRDAIFATWELPADLAPDQTAALRFRLGESGELLAATLAPQSRGPLGASALDAIQRSAPFGPMSPAARCLVDLPLDAYFRNPAHPDRSQESAVER